MCWWEVPWGHRSLHPHLTHVIGCQGSLQSAQGAGSYPNRTEEEEELLGWPSEDGAAESCLVALHPMCLQEEAPDTWQGTCTWPIRSWCWSSQLDLSLPGNGWGQSGLGSGAASTIIMLIPNREFSKEPELMPKTPSQKNRQKKRRISYVQDENRNPIRKRWEGGSAG